MWQTISPRLAYLILRNGIAFVEGGLGRRWTPASPLGSRRSLRRRADFAPTGGGIASLRHDPQGKAMAQVLMDMAIKVPARWLEAGNLLAGCNDSARRRSPRGEPSGDAESQRRPSPPSTKAIPFRKILIANRGEIVCRVARTLRELGIASVAIYHHVEMNARHVRIADEAIEITGETPVAAHLDGKQIVEAALAVGADAIHPGYGFLSETPASRKWSPTPGWRSSVRAQMSSR